jgi:hypothetical protein
VRRHSRGDAVIDIGGHQRAKLTRDRNKSTRSHISSISASETGFPVAFRCSTKRLNASFSALVSHRGTGKVAHFCGFAVIETPSNQRC